MIMQSASWDRSVLMAVMVFLAGALTGCLPSEPPVAQTKTPRVVDTARVMPANGPEQVTLSGQVKASEHTRLSFEVSGEVRSVSVDVGDTVAPGEVLATLDKARYQLAFDQALASEREAAAGLQEARLDHRRQSDLADRGFGSASQLDSARAALETARYRHESAVASRRIAERDLAQTQLKAPFEGTVGQRMVEPAERVSAGQAVLAVISDRDGYEVDTSVPETLVSRLSARSEQAVSIPALGVERMPASVHQIGSEPRSANNYPVTLTLGEALPGLRSGMTAQVHLTMDQADGAPAPDTFRLPLTSLVHDGPQQAHVLRIGPGDRLQRVEVQVIDTAGNHAVVTGALATGERIVARGPEFVAEGQPVSLLGDGPERFH